MTRFFMILLIFALVYFVYPQDAEKAKTDDKDGVNIIVTPDGKPEGFENFENDVLPATWESNSTHVVEYKNDKNGELEKVLMMFNRSSVILPPCPPTLKGIGKIVFHYSIAGKGDDYVIKIQIKNRDGIWEDLYEIAQKPLDQSSNIPNIFLRSEKAIDRYNIDKVKISVEGTVTKPLMIDDIRLRLGFGNSK